MKHLTPQIIAEITKGEYVGSESGLNVRVFGASYDSRNVKPGNLFVCVKGARADGHAYTESAFESGAACCLAEAHIPGAKGPYVLVKSTLEAVKTIAGHYRSSFSIPIIGITGSVGKTTAKELTAAVLGEKFRVHKTYGNLNNELGVPLTLLSLDECHEAAVIEMGISEFGEMSRLSKMVRPDIFIITKIGYAHLKSLGDLSGVLRAKSEAFSFMKPDGIAVLNGDDELLWKYDPKIKKITFGFDSRNDFRAENVRCSGTDFILFDIANNTDRFAAKIPAYGNHMAHLASAAAAVGQILGVTQDGIRRGLLSYAPVGGRANVSATGFITLIDDCYNANPNSVKEALESLSSFSGRRVAILGDMLELGTRSDELHAEIGAFAERHNIDSLICCGDKAKLIFDGYMASGGKTARHFHLKDELILDLPHLISKNDAVLVKASRGMLFEHITSVLREM
ncbi:MAG: UDP-N-acetylmuramoyl-tripeptide--D-alanyl-D-alanine ligase [Oscillospiraceae bacterium]|nr:UDP-N-acetylmuramoyl-tripeptide--D-alanyl-D-alanine ligase [Oscillospiraceae bacterium]